MSRDHVTLSFHVFTTVDTVHQVAFLTYVITSHNVMVYTVINVVSVYRPNTLHNRMSSAAVLISGHEQAMIAEYRASCIRICAECSSVRNLSRLARRTSLDRRWIHRP